VVLIGWMDRTESIIIFFEENIHQAFNKVCGNKKSIFSEKSVWLGIIAHVCNTRKIGNVGHND
jgi:hypothetical protein